ncbi:hypothetical protein Dimus_037331, partial [Dionaea muscipula]
VRVDVAKELVTELHITLLGGKSYVQFVEYEHVPFFCKKCSLLGHEERNCRKSRGGQDVSVQPKVDKPVWRRVENKCDLGVHAVGLQENVVCGGLDGSAWLGSQVSCGNGLISSKAAKIPVQNSFDVLKSLDDPDGHHMMDVEDASAVASGSAHRDDSPKDVLRARRNLRGTSKGGMILLESTSAEVSQRKNYALQPSVQHLAPISGPKIGVLLQKKDLALTSTVSKSILQQSKFSKGRRRGRGGGHLSFS